MAMTIVASGAGHYLHWGVFSVSLTNFLIIVAMIIVFVLAVVIPFGPAGEDDGRDERSRL
jgi:large-conductance mechanosensitive channel